MSNSKIIHKYYQHSNNLFFQKSTTTKILIQMFRKKLNEFFFSGYLYSFTTAWPLLINHEMCSVVIPNPLYTMYHSMAFINQSWNVFCCHTKPIIYNVFGVWNRYLYSCLFKIPRYRDHAIKRDSPLCSWWVPTATGRTRLHYLGHIIDNCLFWQIIVITYIKNLISLNM